jgi:thiol-disulfide isomerase/thioredoxin
MHPFAALVALHLIPLAAVPADLTLVDAAGRKHTPADWASAKAVVLFILNTECPVSNGYAPEMARLAREYDSHGVLFLGVHPDPDVSAEAAAAHARQYGLRFPTLLDPKQKLVRAVGARVTPEAVVLSPRGEVLYRGRIDDKYALDGKRRDEASVHDLDLALRAVLAGKPVAKAETPGYGCPLPRPSCGTN